MASTPTAGTPFDLTPEQEEIRRVCRDFAAREIRPISAAVDEADVETPWEIFHKAAALGLTSFMLPEDLGGGGMTDVLTGCVVQEELCHGCSGIGNLITSGGFFAEPVLALGTDAQKERWVRPLAGETPPMTALATTEPNAGSDAASIQTTARRVDGGYVLDGQKTWISNGGVAELYVVFATVQRGSGHRGITAFLLHRDDEGLSFGQPMRKMGQRGIVNAEVFLSGVRVPVENRLGDEGIGFKIAMAGLDGGRLNIAACSLGGAQSALDKSLAYMKERKAFGKRLDEFQALQFRLADMATDLEAARTFVWRAAAALDRKDADATMLCAMAKRFGTDVGFEVANQALQLHGGYGYLSEYGIEKIVRDLRVHQILEGTNEIMRLIVSRKLIEGA